MFLNIPIFLEQNNFIVNLFKQIIWECVYLQIEFDTTNACKILLLSLLLLLIVG